VPELKHWKQMRVVRGLLLFLAAFAWAEPVKVGISEDVRTAVARLSADSLRGHLSFIASDALEGRGTPSRGLDIAAEYIAAQFRRAGLEPAGDDGYFQTANWHMLTQPLEGLLLTIEGAAKPIQVPGSGLIFTPRGELSLAPTAVYKLDMDRPQIGASAIAGKVVVLERRQQRIGDFTRLVNRIRREKPALIVYLRGVPGGPTAAEWTRLRNPESPVQPMDAVILTDADAVSVLEAAQPGALALKIGLHVPKPVERPVKLRNVAGLLRGSDPILKDTYVLVTAHYDHVGMKPDGDGDRIYNGANDDGSGTVSVIEIASTLAAAPNRPRRSILFITHFGEEEGLYGSEYYASHPLFPLEKTVANINLEQLGRPDSLEGPVPATLSFTGFDYSDVPEYFEAGANQEAVKIYKHGTESDAYFARSDNQSYANRGIPAHTLIVAFDFPDYHQVGDEWQKIDFENMAKVDRVIAFGVHQLADSTDIPRWNTANSRTEPYVRAWKARHPE
jgi:hypothetical protein